MLFLIFFYLNTINCIFNSPHLVNNEQYPFIHYVKSEMFLLITDSKKMEINYLTYESSAQDTSFQSNKYDEKINSDIGQFASNNIKAYDYFTEGGGGVISLFSRNTSVTVNEIYNYIDIFFPLNEHLNYIIIVANNSYVQFLYRLYVNEEVRSTYRNYFNNLTISSCSSIIMIRCIPYSNTISYCFYLCSQSIKGVAINFSSFTIASSIFCFDSLQLIYWHFITMPLRHQKNCRVQNCQIIN